jgi:phosphoribosylformylglycinamidine synthase
MPLPRVLVLRAPGTNCDQETAFAFERAGGKAEIVHVNRLRENPAIIDRFQILCIPGGFSYGDDLGAGRILGVQLQHYLADTLDRFKDDGKLILGICNGFQVLLKTRLLAEVHPQQGPAATLTFNDSGRFEDRWVRLGVQGTRCVFLDGMKELELPVAHAEGKFVARDAATFAALQSAGQLVLRYLPLRQDGIRLAPQEKSKNREQHCPASTASPLSTDAELAALPYPDNPNGSMGNVAGMCDATGRVLGLMPHPERHIDPTHHPRWTRGEARPEGDGLKLFHNAVRYFAA